MELHLGLYAPNVWTPPEGPHQFDCHKTPDNRFTPNHGMILEFWNEQNYEYDFSDKFQNTGEKRKNGASNRL